VTIAEFLRNTTQQFAAAGILTARLDTQVLLERALKQNKAWLLAHGEEEITPEKLAVLQAQAAHRASREPLAYIVQTQEFYGRNFVVTPDVLIPRPETEAIIEELKALPLPDQSCVLDVGTGSGAIAITAALELPHLHTEACDVSVAALAVAQKNAQRLDATVTFFESDLLTRAEHKYHAILANLPYVAKNWERSPETNFEPGLALFAANNGLELIKKLIVQAPKQLNKNGYLLLEADPRQFAAIQQAAKSTFTHIGSNGFTMVLQKI